MKLAALFAKIAARDPSVFPAWEVLRMATIEGAQAVGLGDEVGSLEAGLQANLVRWRLRAGRHRLDLTELNLSPVLEAPVRVPECGPAQPDLCGQRARGCDGDGRGPGAGT